MGRKEGNPLKYSATRPERRGIDDIVLSREDKKTLRKTTSISELARLG